MEAAIVFAVVFVPFFAFAIWAYRVNKRLPESALAHLEAKVYRMEGRKGLNAVAAFFDVALLGVLLLIIGGPAIYFLFLKANPLYILPGVKAALALLYMMGTIPLLLLNLMLSAHNIRRMHEVVLDLKPREGLIGWELAGERLELTTEDFTHIHTDVRYGKYVEVVSAFSLKSGEKLYLTPLHPGGDALWTMLKGVPRSIREYQLPIVPTRVPKLLASLHQGFYWMKRRYGFEALAIVFCLIALYALQYYVENQRNLPSLLPSKALQIVGDHISRGSKGSLNYHLWAYDGSREHEIQVPKSFYEQSIHSGSAVFYYSRFSDKYLYRETDFTGLRLAQILFGAILIFLLGRILWLVQKRGSRSEAHAQNQRSFSDTFSS